jgi:hypothetical protein
MTLRRPTPQVSGCALPFAATPYHGPLQLLVRRPARGLVVCLHVLPLGLCNDKLQLFALKSDPWHHDRARIVS